VQLTEKQEPTETEGEQSPTEEEDFLFQVAKDPREEVQGLTAVGKRCFCYCYCTKG
jgi:hypothetical protein